jgi:hypothetical protein
MMFFNDSIPFPGVTTFNYFAIRFDNIMDAHCLVPPFYVGNDKTIATSVLSQCAASFGFTTIVFN